MKKFMKAIAFATVMCMLLSVAAFAAETDGNAEWGTGATVEVVINAGEANANQQLALVVSTAATADQIATGNIEDVQQVELDGNGSRTITLGTGEATAVNIFYGYAGRGEAGKLVLAAQAVEPEETVVVTFVEFINDDTIKAAAKEDGSTIPATDTDKAGAVIAKVNVTKAEGKTIKDMIWSFRYKTSEESEKVEYAYAKADSKLFDVLVGDVEIGLAFSNGNDKEVDGIAEVIVTDLEAIVKLVDAENVENILFSDVTDADRENK